MSCFPPSPPTQPIISTYSPLFWFPYFAAPKYSHVPSLRKEPISLSPISPYTERENVISISSSWFMPLLCWKWEEICSSMLPSTIKQSWSEPVWPDSQHPADTLCRKPFSFVEPAQVVGMVNSFSSTSEDAVSTPFDEWDDWCLLSSSSRISLLFWNP